MFGLGKKIIFFFLEIPKTGIKMAEDWAERALKAKNYSLAVHIITYLNGNIDEGKSAFVCEELCKQLRSHARGKAKIELQKKLHDMISENCFCCCLTKPDSDSVTTEPLLKRIKISK